MASKFRIPIEFAFTPIPNAFIEHHLLELNLTQIRVYLTLMRLTRGHQKKRDAIAISQIVKMSGIPRRTVNRALQSLRNFGLLEVTGPAKRPKIFEIQIPKKGQIRSATALALPAVR